VEGNERSRLHEIVDRLPEQELGLACQLLQLLAYGGAALRAAVAGGPAIADGHDDEDDDDGTPDASPETIAKLAQLTDEELMRLDDLLESDHEGARQFWRDRFGEEMPDDDLVV
jgi:hypothetical protein